MPFILGGAMGPVTTAGALAQCFAEAMVCVALTQLERPGAPVILGNFLSSMSLRTGAPTFGTPEPALAYFAIGQLARRLGVPLRCGGNLCASKIADAQAAAESANSLLAGHACRRQLHPARRRLARGRAVMGYEKFMIDAEQCGAMHVLAGGMPLDENALRLDAFARGRAGQATSSARAHHGELTRRPSIDFTLSDNNSFEQWSEEGSTDIASARQPPWKKVLREFDAAAAGSGDFRRPRRLRHATQGGDAGRLVLSPLRAVVID